MKFLLVIAFLFMFVGGIYVMETSNTRSADLEAQRIVAEDNLTFEERTLSAMQNQTNAAVASNVAIAASGFAAVTSITYAHAMRDIIFAAAITTVAVAFIINAFGKQKKRIKYEDVYPEYSDQPR